MELPLKKCGNLCAYKKESVICAVSLWFERHSFFWSILIFYILFQDVPRTIPFSRPTQVSTTAKPGSGIEGYSFINGAPNCPPGLELNENNDCVSVAFYSFNPNAKPPQNKTPQTPISASRTTSKPYSTTKRNVVYLNRH